MRAGWWWRQRRRRAVQDRRRAAGRGPGTRNGLQSQTHSWGSNFPWLQTGASFGPGNRNAKSRGRAHSSLQRRCSWWGGVVGAESEKILTEIRRKGEREREREREKERL